MSPLILASLVFYVSHIGLSVAPVRRPLAAMLGEWQFVVLYSVLSVVLFGWMVWAYLGAPSVPLWSSPAGLRLVPILLMAPALIFLVCGYSQANPTAIGQGPGRAIVGIIRVTRHPLMWAVILWAGSHLLVVGDGASVLFFGGLVAFAIYGMLRFDAKKRSLWGAAWADFAARTSVIPFAAILAGRNRLVLSEIGLWRFALAGLLYVGIFIAHGLY